MHKVLVIVTSAFLPTDNDIEKRGQVLRVRSDRARRIERANGHNYKTFYASDGKSYTYPKLLENRLGVKGNLYFQNMEITWSKENGKISKVFTPYLLSGCFIP